MSIDRKTAEVRERELRLALLRIQRGRSRTKAKRLSVAAVAREAGVTAALIHNHYPGLAAAIREAMGRGERASREAKNQELKALRARARELNDEVKALRADVARLASINEVLMAENTSFKAKGGAHGTVMSLSPTSRRDGVLPAVPSRRPA
jgi:AcrR family transcriptional regulator